MKNNIIETKELLNTVEREVTLKIADPTMGTSDTFWLRANIRNDYVGVVTVKCKIKIYKQYMAIGNYKTDCGYEIQCSYGRIKTKLELPPSTSIEECIEQGMNGIKSTLEDSPSFNFDSCIKLGYSFDGAKTWSEYISEYDD